jgi:hypothetical protein
MQNLKITRALRKIRKITNFDDHERLANLNSYEAGELLLHINDLAIKALESKSTSNRTKNKEAK